MTTATTTTFDYTLISSERLALDMQASAERLRVHAKRTIHEILENGAALLYIKDQCPHGTFLDWIDAQCQIGERMAQHYMNIAERFAGKNEMISDLPVAVLCELAAPKLMDVTDSVLARILAGEIAPTGSAVRQAIAQEKSTRGNDAASGGPTSSRLAQSPQPMPESHLFEVMPLEQTQDIEDVVSQQTFQAADGQHLNARQQNHMPELHGLPSAQVQQQMPDQQRRIAELEQEVETLREQNAQLRSQAEQDHLVADAYKQQAEATIVDLRQQVTAFQQQVDYYRSGRSLPQAGQFAALRPILREMRELLEQDGYPATLTEDEWWKMVYIGADCKMLDSAITVIIDTNQTWNPALSTSTSLSSAPLQQPAAIQQPAPKTASSLSSAPVQQAIISPQPSIHPTPTATASHGKPANEGQRKAIAYYRQRLGKHQKSIPANLSYQDAQKLIEDLKDALDVRQSPVNDDWT